MVHKKTIRIIVAASRWCIMGSASNMLNRLRKTVRQSGMSVPIDLGGIPDLQQFAESSELSGVQQFLGMFRKQHLERCLFSKSSGAELDAGLREFLIDLAEISQSSIVDAAEIFSQYVHEIGVLAELENQLRIQKEQFDEKFEGLQNFYKNLNKGKRYHPVKVAKYNLERELLTDFLGSLYHQIVGVYDVGCYIFDAYWVYLPIDIQEALLMWADVQVGDNELPEDAPTVFKEASLRMKKSLLRVKEIGMTKLPFRISDYAQRDSVDCQSAAEDNSTDFPSNTSTPQKKKYTLRDMVEGVTPENSHEATDWGRPVGEEFW